jgi:hypothetical protein
MQHVPPKVALNLHPVLSMKFYIHDIVRRLLELHGLEDRWAALQRDPDERTNAEALIKSLRATLPASVLIVHDKMRSKGKRSVAEVRHGVCAGCHLALGIGNIAAIRAMELRGCGNCGRYVYVVEQEESDQALPTRAKRKPSRRGPKLDPEEKSGSKFIAPVVNSGPS